MPRMSRSTGGGVDGMKQWTPRGDPMLALLPAERPWAFDRLPFEEQQWRARVFLAVWINTGGMMFAWAQALRNEANDAERKAWVLANLTLDVILDGLQSREQPEEAPKAVAALDRRGGRSCSRRHGHPRSG
jgi:hypothetical protein